MADKNPMRIKTSINFAACKKNLNFIFYRQRYLLFITLNVYFYSALNCSLKQFLYEIIFSPFRINKCVSF